MIQFYDTKIKDVVIHFVGNKSNDDDVRCSKSVLKINEEITNVLINYFVKPFLRSDEQYTFFHETDLKYNEVYNYILSIFNNTDNLFGQSVNLAKHLYEQSVHPKIKGGDFYTVYFKDCILDGVTNVNQLPCNWHPVMRVAKKMEFLNAYEAIYSISLISSYNSLSEIFACSDLS